MNLLMQITTLDFNVQNHFPHWMIRNFDLPLWLSMKTLTHTGCCFDLERLDCLASLTSENQNNIRTYFIIIILKPFDIFLGYICLVYSNINLPVLRTHLEVVQSQLFFHLVHHEKIHPKGLLEL